MSTMILMDGNQATEIVAELGRLSMLVRNQQREDLFEQILDSKEAARYLKITVRHLDKLRADKKLGFMQDGRLIRYRRKDLEKYLEGHYVNRSN